MQINHPADSLLGLPHWNDVLATKIFAPRLSGTTVLRNRLIERLNVFNGYAVTLVVAPAGFGKTTLLAQWRDQPDVRSAWLSLDGHERTVPQFVSNIVAAVIQSRPELRDRWEPLQQVLQWDRRSPGASLGTDRDARAYSHSGAESAILQAIIEIASTFTKDITVILDDYHNVESNEVHAFVNRLIGHMPTSMHLIIGSRTTPPLQISRLRAQGLLRELRAPQLLFQSDEVHRFLNDGMRLNVTRNQAELLVAKTEGWVAGIQLAAISLQENGDLESLVGSFDGANPYVLGYLADEVLDRQPQSLQEFLMKTSILSRLSEEVCDYITGQGSGGESLERLEELNLFIVALDDGKKWFRYHALFADLLRLRLHQQYSQDEIQDLHRRASQWFMRNECIDLGVEHALQAHDWNLIRNVVEPVGAPMIFEFRSIRKWLLSLSDGDLRQSPTIATLAGWAAISAGRFRDAGRMASVADEALEHSADKQANGFAVALKSRIASLSGGGQLAISTALTALHDVSSLDYHARSMIFYTLGMAYHAAGLPIDAADAFDKARREIQQAQRLKNVMTILIVTYRARALLLQGRISDAWAVVEEAGELAAEFALPKASGTFLIQAEILVQRNQLQAARAALVEAIALGRQRGLGLYVPAAQASLVGVCAALGEMRAAEEVLGDLRRWSVENNNAHYLRLAEAAYMTHCIIEGDLVEPRLWIDRIGIADVNLDEFDYEHEKELFVYARLLVADGFLRDNESLVERGIRIFEKLRDAAENASRRLDAAAAQAAHAIALARLRVGNSYLPSLKAALKTAVEEHAYYALLIDGDAMRSLLDETERRGELIEFISAVRAELGHVDVDTRRLQRGISEPLSEREHVVLVHLASGLSTKEIADALVVSTNTVKTHIRHIYDKLDAHSRTQALARARDLGILE